MLSVSELRQILETAFLPLSCSCTVNADGSLAIRVFEPRSGRIELLLTGVSTEDLTSVRAAANFVAELRTEIRAGRRAFAGGF
ncbi:DUF1652 domain-containing protein [Pseudomonas chlororaphis]|uniref:DUF1652 domain-containing protein n=1 Tax=Pseudomonas chlororaphis TaxID=587753 RepID=UPI001E51056E|nr:DUF1652 domain-containing protein [Pseudomonas chlororaphis]MCB2252419.1 DUF1652 domain-containing protein [Pseudomonas chlororaphis]